MLDLKTSKTKIGFIGAGHMASAMIAGLLQQGYSSNQLMASSPHLREDSSLITKTQIAWTNHNLELVRWADCLVLCVKPLQVMEVCQAIAPLLKEQPKLTISVAAGVTHASLLEWLPVKQCVRAMPNLPATLGLGITGVLSSPNLTQEQITTTESILKAIGSVLWIDSEKQMDVVTALSGSGPGFLFAYGEAMIDAAIELGLSASQARTLCLETLRGSAELALQSTHSLTQLREQVTSPGGTTEAGLAQLLPVIRPLMKSTLEAASLRSAELSQLVSNPSRS